MKIRFNSSSLYNRCRDSKNIHGQGATNGVTITLVISKEDRDEIIKVTKSLEY